MRIGVDASCWANKRGYGRYTRELLRALVALAPTDEFLFFLDDQTAQASADLPTSGRVRVVTASTSQAATQAASADGQRNLRDLWIMGREVSRREHQLDLFFFPSVYSFFPTWLRAPVVVTIHDTIPERYPAYVFRTRRARAQWTLKARWAALQAHTLVTVSATARQDIVQVFGVSPGKVHVVPDAVTPEFRPLARQDIALSVLERYGLARDTRFILYVGGISPHKNLSTLIDAYTRLVVDTAFRDVRLALVGDIQADSFLSSYPQLQSAVGRSGYEALVRFTGFVSDAELVQLYNAAQVAVLPSLSEGFGLPALEAMACGTPVVVSRAGALPEVVGAAGLFFDPLQPAELAERLRELLSQPELRHQCARRGLVRARDFSWERSARAALGLFRAVVEPGYRLVPQA